MKIREIKYDTFTIKINDDGPVGYVCGSSVTPVAKIREWMQQDIIQLISDNKSFIITQEEIYIHQDILPALLMWINPSYSKRVCKVFNKSVNLFQ